MHCRGLAQALPHAAAVTSLDLSNSELNKVPAIVFRAFPALQQLDLSRNQLRSLPRRLTKLTQLQRLVIDHNQVSRLPDNVEALEHLRKLSAVGNRLRTLPHLPTRIEVVDFGHNRFKSFPASLLACQQLLHVDLRNNHIKELPKTLLTDWPQLQYLQLSANHLSKLPALPTGLYALEGERNRIGTLPGNWGSLQRLSRVNLANNPIAMQSADIACLSALSWINVFRTPTSWGNITTLLTAAPHLTYSVGGLSKRAQEQLEVFLNYASACPAGIPMVAYYHLMQGKQTTLTDEQLCHGLSAEQPAVVAAQAHHLLCQTRRPTQRAFRSLPWRIIGKTQLEKDVLQRKLLTKGYIVLETTEETKAIGILGTVVEQTDINLPDHLISERDLLHQLDKKEGRYLTARELGPEHLQAERYLASNRPNQFSLGIGLLRAFGTPDMLLPSLWRLYNSDSPLAQADWSDVLLPYLPICFQRFLTGRVPSHIPNFSKRLERLLWAAMPSGK